MGNPIRVLYLDDEPALLDITKRYLEKEGLFSVDIVTSAYEALRIISLEEYDAIISDYQMPDMNGIEFLKKVRATGNFIPFIIFTGRGREEVVIEALNSGADFYIQKGGDPIAQFAELSNKILYAVKRRHAEEVVNSDEAQLRQIIDLVPHMIFAKDWNGNYILANQAVAEGYNTTVSKLVGKPQTLFHRNSTELMHMLEDDREVMTSGKIKFIPEEPYIDAFGKQRFLQTVKVPFTALGSNKQAVLGVAIDITERKQIEEALRESEQRYRNVIEDQTEFISRFLPDGTHVFVNEAYCRYFGLKREEILGHRFRPKIPIGDQERVKKFFESLTPDHPVGIIEHRIVMTDGTIRWQRWSDRAIFNSLGIVTEYQSVGRDTTENKQVEEALIESEEKYRSVIESFADPISVVDREFKITLANTKLLTWLRTLGRSDDIIGKQLLDAFPFLPHSVLDEYRTVFAKGTILVSEEATQIDNAKIVTETRKIPLKRNNDIVAVIAVIRDITDRKFVEEALRKSEENYRLIAENTADIIWIFDMNLHLTYISPSVEKIRGFTVEEALKQTLDQMLTPESAAAAIKLFNEEMAVENRGIADPNRTLFIETEDYCKNGSTIWVQNSISLLREADGLPYAILGISHDITERKRTEEVLRLANRKLNLLSLMTRHDINNQLTLLQSYLEILGNKYLDPPFDEYFQKCTSAARQISAMIRFTKEYEEIGVHVPVWQDCRSLIEMAANEVPIGKITVENDIPPGKEIFADPLITKVFYNLIDNAVKYGGTLSIIRFSAEGSGDNLVIICEDDGKGIPFEEKEKIFNRGFGKNTGLGLFLSREILDITGVKIKETSEPDKGARFEITIPKGMWRLITH